MRWVVELPAPSGGTAATVTVESDSWAGALSSARGGVSIRKFRCEFENEGVVRVNDLETSQRYTVRPYRASLVPPGGVPMSAPPVEAAPAVLRGVTIPPASTRPSRSPPASGGAGGFSVPLPPGTSVTMPPRSSVPAPSPVAADPTANHDAPPARSGTLIFSSAPPGQPAASVEAAPPVAETPATREVVEAPASPPAPVAVAAEPAEAAAAPAANGALAAAVTEAPIVVAPAPPDEAPLPVPESPGAVAPPTSDAFPGDPPAANGTDAAMVSGSLLFERDQDPSATNPLTYRERVLSVASGTTVAQAEALARHTLTTLKRSLATRPRGRYVTVAVFDHVFTQRPTESPLVVLRWKDWRGDVAELLVRPALPATAIAPGASPPTNGATAEAPAEVPAAPAPAEAPAEVAASVPPAPVVETPVVAEASPPPPVVETPVVAEAPPPAPAIETPSVTPAPTAEPEPPSAVAQVVEPSPAVAEASLATPTPVVPVLVEATPVEPVAAPAPAEATPPAPSEEGAPSVVAPSAAEAASVDAPAAPVVETAVPAAPEGSASVEVDKGATGPESIASGPEVEDAPSKTGNDAPAAVDGESGGRSESQPAPPEVEQAAPAEPAAAEAPVVSPDRKRFAGGRRGPDLLSDLFDSVMELSFQHGADEVCAFVANVVTQNLRCDAVLVFAYDINRDEFVVQGEANTGRLEQRVRAKAGSYGVATRSKRGVNLPHARSDDRADDACEGGPAIYVPALFRERLFALVQVARLPGSPAFEADELDAVTYLSGQLAEALAQHSLRQAAADLAEKHEPSKKAPGRRR